MKKSEISSVPTLHWMPVGLLSNFPDMTAAITSWFWSLSIPRGTTVILDHAGLPESHCQPPKIPWDRAELGSVCPWQETCTDLPTQQTRRRGCAEAHWCLVKGNLWSVWIQLVASRFRKSKSHDTWVPPETLP